jgi:hypothetical protein
MSQIDESEFFSKLDALGEKQVRINLSKNVWTKDSGKLPLAEEWLRIQEASRNNALEAEKSGREEEANIIAREANSIAREALFNSQRATRLAISAIMLSISMAILEIIKWYSK